MTAGPGDEDVDDRTHPLEDLPENGGRQVTQQGALASRKHRRHPACPVGERWVPDGIDTPVNVMEAAGFQSSPRELIIEAERVDL
jgi:hypothetical protein